MDGLEACPGGEVPVARRSVSTGIQEFIFSGFAGSWVVLPRHAQALPWVALPPTSLLAKVLGGTPNSRRIVQDLMKALFKDYGKGVEVPAFAGMTVYLVG